MAWVRSVDQHQCRWVVRCQKAREHRVRRRCNAFHRARKWVRKDLAFLHRRSDQALKHYFKALEFAKKGQEYRQATGILKDIADLYTLGLQLEGVIVGKALYEDCFTLAEAISVGRGEEV